MKQCPFCAESIQDEAIRCRYCGSDLRPAAPGAPIAASTAAVPERNVYHTTLHWIVFSRTLLWLAAAAICAAIFGLDSTAGGELGKVSAGIFLVVALVDFTIHFLRRSSTHFTLTNRRLTMSTGLLQKRSLEIVLPKIESVVVNEPFWGRVFGYGTVIVGGTGGTKESFPLVAHPQELRNRVQDQLVAQPR